MVIKRGLLVLFLVFFFVKTVNASSFGVSPAKYEVDFVPGLEGEYKFNFFSDNPELEFEVSVRGDLAEYITLDKETFCCGSGSVTAALNLPDAIETPGPHSIEVGAKPVSTGRVGANVGIVARVNGLIRVWVPYPGKYADVDFSVGDANSGEKAPYNLEISSRGDDTILTNSAIEVFDSENKSAGTYYVGIDTIPPAQDVKIASEIDVSNLGSGSYRAVASVSYEGGVKKAEDDFKLGTLNVKIINYTRSLKKNAINPFTIEVESFWNDKIENLYAEVFVEGTDISFKTPSVQLKAWSKTKLLGYFDTTDLKNNEQFQVKMVLHYDGETTEETAILSFVKTTNYLKIGSIIFAAFSILLFCIWVVLKLKKLEKNGKKK